MIMEDYNVNDEYKFYLEANIQLHEETSDLRKAASSVIKLPKGDKKQMDLQYFSAVFVSSGINLNGAHFLSSELIKAEGTIINKALDIEHKEEEIIGHLYNRAFVDKEGNHISTEELASMETADLDATKIHVVVAGIIYKNRFPDIANEVANNEWKVSMECYYEDFDVKIGGLLLHKNEAEALGITFDSENLFGKFAKVIKNGVEIAQGNLVRTLRGICFSGCGIVKEPANPPSVILETASDEAKDVLIFNYDSIKDIADEGASIDESIIPEVEEQSELQHNDTVGICVSYKKRIYDSTFEGPDTKVLHEDWCTIYEKSCTAFSRDTTDPNCLRNKINNTTKACVNKFIEEREKLDRRNGLVEALNTVLDKAKKLL